jgi:hypothetical protein
MERSEMKAQLMYLLELLKDAEAKLASQKIAAGLDGFVDSIVKVINYKNADTEPVFFQTIEAFGNYIVGKKGSGFSLESEELFQKLGGNMPIMANAMACMGTQVSCIGAFGVPAIVPVFSGMHSNCKLFSYTNPGLTTAIEFTDGKMMLAQMTDLNHAQWASIKQALSLEKIIAIYQESDLVCLVNWSELDNSNDIWAGILQEVVVPQEKIHRDKQFFFDLSDCSKRSVAAVETALGLIKQFNRYGGVTLSLNRNEAGLIYQTCFTEMAGEDWEATGARLFGHLNIDTLIIHSAKNSMAWDQKGFYLSEPVFIADPMISTGAGDNFNAGFCIARLLGGNVGGSIELANIAAGLYMRTGESTSLKRLQAYISELTDECS